MANPRRRRNRGRDYSVSGDASCRAVRIRTAYTEKTGCSAGYRADRARRTLRGVHEQVGKAEEAVAGKVPVKRNRFIKLAGATKGVGRYLETKARGLAGIKGYVTNLENPSADFVIGAYHQLWRIEKSFRMSKHDLRARPIWRYVYRAVDQRGQVVDVYVSQRRDIASARTFFTAALAVHGDPAEVITDRAPALANVIEDLVPAAWHNTGQYQNTSTRTTGSSATMAG
jgi:hypothetical protein